MGKYFVHDTPLAELERQMMMAPNFSSRGYGRAILCRYRPTAADVDCRNCLEHRRHGCRSLTCLYLSERLEAGVATLDELIAEAIRPWKHLPLKQRAISVNRACRTEGFHFEGQLHILRMMEMVKGESEYADSRWLAAVYLLSAHAALWQKTTGAVSPGQIDFSKVRLRDSTIQDLSLIHI